MSRSRGLSALGLCSLPLWLALLALGPLRSGALVDAFVIYGLLSLLYLVALTRGGAASGPATTRDVIAVALAARLILLFQEPSLSDDIYRYLWEGRVQLAGYSPYLYSPDNPALTALRDGDWLSINHKQVPAIYPPVMQALFALNALLAGSVWSMKLLLIGADMALIKLLEGMLARRGRAPAELAIYAWHPLVILEVAGQGHFEPIPVGLLLLAIDALDRGRPALSSAALWLSIGAKYLSLGLAPAAARLAGARAWWLGPALLAAITLPYLATGFNLDALGQYGASWRFNDSGFTLVDLALQKSGASAWFCRHLLPLLKTIPPGVDPGEHTTWLLLPAKLAIAATIATALLTLAWRRRPLLDSSVLFIGAFLLFSPVVHPWYLVWLVALLPLRPQRAWLGFSLTVPLSYEILTRYDGSGATWTEAPWVKALIFLPWLGLAVYDTYATRPRRTTNAPDPHAPPHSDRTTR